ncbi:MAG: helix-turn-helix domain-containing protein [Pseudomonadota bacterium]|uniref:IclR family transcriptional regulator n=1 Tax=Polaromonas aquatica TaxID=332657 RepID=A0ABW1TTP0_9BURK
MRRRTTIAQTPPAPAAAVDSLQRGLEALRCFRPGDDTLGTAELASRLNLPRNTTLRLLTTLQAHGFLRRLPDTDEFSLDVECLFVGQALLGSSLLVRRARPVLQTLAARFGLHVLLCVPERLDMLTLLHTSGSAAKPLPLAAGLTLPVATTALGCAWLWTQQPAVQGEWLARLRESAPATGGDSQAAKIYQAFHEIEKGGTCFSQDDWRKDVSMVAAPLVMRDGSTAAIACMNAETQGRADFSPECCAALSEAAKEISHAIQGSAFRFTQ